MTDPATAAVGAAFAAGDQGALREAYDRWGALIHTLATRALRDPDEAQDVTQTTFVAAWQSRERFDPTRGSLPAWLLGIARHKIVDRQRALMRRPVLVRDPAEGGDPGSEGQQDDGLDMLADRLLVAELLDGLPPDRRRLLDLAFIRQRTHREIAEELGMPLGTVKSHIRRTLAQLARQLGEEAGP